VSKFVIVKCNCGYEQAVFKRITSAVNCGSCKAVIAQPRGGVAKFIGTVEKELD
jgi:ribosomal protein S27E